ncbi:MAG: glycine oxidase ThiO [Sandaracinus sp.]|nr:glycine oxidase ThiO [Sandaracinus sp.]|tara:strand:- start:1838 stop:2971 length:1134 start_codon:yes stop_codon:yes gene_type:complete
MAANGKPDVLIIGGGVMGCSTALRLQRAGMSTLVLERSVPGAEASSAAAGMLAPGAEAGHPVAEDHVDALLRLGSWSRDLHETQAAWIREEHGVDIGFRRTGAMVVAFAGEEAKLAEHAASLGASYPHELLAGDPAREREPSLSSEVVRALDLPAEAQLEPVLLLRALALAAERAGAVFRSGAYVHEILTGGDRVRGVRVGPEVLEAPHVVVAAGSWTSLVPGLELAAAGIHPVRGQILATETRPPVFRRLIFGAGGYVATRPDGRVLTGSTEERVGYRREVTLGGIRSIVDVATRLAPRLAQAPLRDQWSSFRPGTADGLPLVGAAGPENLWLASGHFRNGILLAPATAELVAHHVLGSAIPEDLPLALVDPRRFG